MGSFQEYAESLRSRVRTGAVGVPAPALIGVTACVLVALLVVGVHAVGLFGSSGVVIERSGQSFESQGEEAPAESDGAPTPEVLVTVHVGGAVVSPGVQSLSEGSRVQDAVAAAGGFSEDALRDALNLARVLVDGEQVIVPSAADVSSDTGNAESAGPASSSASGSGATVGGKLNINRATAEELDALPGVGPSTAQKIVADREANGPFSRVEDLKRVSGIGDKKFDGLVSEICVG